MKLENTKNGRQECFKMKAKKKLKKIEEFLDKWPHHALTEGDAFRVIRDIVRGPQQVEEEPEPKFVPGDQVWFGHNLTLQQADLILYNEEFVVEEMHEDGTSALIHVWVDVEHLTKV